MPAVGCHHKVSELRIRLTRCAILEEIFAAPNDVAAASKCGFLHGLQQEICVSQFAEALNQSSSCSFPSEEGATAPASPI
jgi:hypothetical protein